MTTRQKLLESSHTGMVFGMGRVRVTGRGSRGKEVEYRREEMRKLWPVFEDQTEAALVLVHRKGLERGYMAMYKERGEGMNDGLGCS